MFQRSLLKNKLYTIISIIKDRPSQLRFKISLPFLFMVVTNSSNHIPSRVPQSCLEGFQKVVQNFFHSLYVFLLKTREWQCFFPCGFIRFQLLLHLSERDVYIFVRFLMIGKIGKICFQRVSKDIFVRFLMIGKIGKKFVSKEGEESK